MNWVDVGYVEEHILPSLTWLLGMGLGRLRDIGEEAVFPSKYNSQDWNKLRDGWLLPKTQKT